MKQISSALAVIAALAFISPPVAAASVSATLSITVQPASAPLTISFSPLNPTEACTVAAGTVVSTVSTSGGDGNPVTLSMTGDTTDFVLSGSNVVVGPNGITLADCGMTETVTVTATQP